MAIYSVPAARIGGCEGLRDDRSWSRESLHNVQ
jgi:hypothetical protein